MCSANAQWIVDTLRKEGYTMALAESCTGGMAAAELVGVSGASEVFSQGYVTYSDQAKHAMLGVPLEILQKYTAVSRETAYQMALRVADKAGSDIGMGVTGYAGPTGGTEDHPVGTVFLSCNVRGTVTVLECHFEGERQQVRQQSVTALWGLLQDCLKNKLTK